VESYNSQDKAEQNNSHHTKARLAILVAIVFLVVTGLAGWKWYGQIQEYKTNKNDADKRISQLESQLAALKSQQAKSASTGIKTDKTDEYLVVSEWGVKFDISDAPQGVRYKIKQVTGDTFEANASVLYWYASEKDTLGTYCADEEARTVSIVKSSKPSVTIMGESQDGKKVAGNYYYIGSSLGGGPCSDGVKEGDSATNNPILAKELKIHQQFIAISNSIQVQ
jgi:hypothetical protein